MLSRMCVAVTLLACAFASAEAEQAPPPDTAKPAPDDPAALSAGFWGEVKKTEASESFAALKAAMGGAAKTAAAKPSSTQRIVDVAVQKPEEVAKVMSEASAAPSDGVSANAVATAVNMITSPATREAAAQYVAPEAQERVETFRANLSTGIPGLPGIYLGDNSGATSGYSECPSAPSGYTPVSGGSSGCPVR